MRPIDGDALDKMLSDAQTKCKRNGGNFRVGVLSNVRENIANVPTIDAIPVEWLNNKITNGNADIHRCAARVLFEWQKEQEART